MDISRNNNSSKQRTPVPAILFSAHALEKPYMYHALSVFSMANPGQVETISDDIPTSNLVRISLTLFVRIDAAV